MQDDLLREFIQLSSLTIRISKKSSPKQMIQRSPIALVQVKADNTFENFVNEIRQIIYFLYQVKEITKKVYNNILNSRKL